MLQLELDHRVKNMLSQIVALCHQTATRSTTDRHLIDDLASRVASLSGVHELLNDRGQVGLPLEELVRECCEPYLPSPDHMDMSGPELFVCPKAAMCLSLLTNELATNACKYGSLTRDEGHVEVRWRVVGENEENPCVLWQWIETRGAPPSGEIVPGFGTKMLKEMIPYELSGTAELSFTSDGFQFSATIPIEHFTSAA